MIHGYIDALIDSKHRESVWKIVAIGFFGVILVQAVSLCVISAKLVSNIDRVRYILSPGVQSLTTVRPGELSENYIEQSFLHITEKLNSWSYESIKELRDSEFHWCGKVPVRKEDHLCLRLSLKIS